jgi:hypothetical protein
MRMHCFQQLLLAKTTCSATAINHDKTGRITPAISSGDLLSMADPELDKDVTQL